MHGAENPTDSAAQPAGEPWPAPLRYFAKRPVSWLSPREIWRGGYWAYLASVFGAYADNRESQAALREPVVHHRLGPSATAAKFSNDPLPWHDPELAGAYETVWVDYVADLGDGFNATYTVATHLATPIEDAASSIDLPASDLIVMGGDEVYPAASAEAYRHRTVGPYRTALGPEREDFKDGRRVPLFAIPGNHDWYDGLAAFLDRFTVFKPGCDRARLRGWRTHQTRSYFAVQLTERWWLWGIDIALEADIDPPQMEYFADVAAMMPPGSRILLCTAKPGWLKRKPPGRFARLMSRFGFGSDDGTRPDDSWDRLSYFLAKTVGGRSAAADLRVRAVLAGDKHFYARHVSTDPDAPELIVAGGGGAYLSSTLEAPTTLGLSSDFGQAPDTTYQAAVRWPSPRRSALLGLTASWRFPLRNPGLAGLLGALYALLAWAALAGSGGALATRNRTVAIDGLAVEALTGPGGFEAGAAFVGVASGAVDAVRVSGSHLAGAVLWVVLALAMLGLAAAHRVNRTKAVIAATIHTLLHAAGVGVTVTLAASAAVRLGPGGESFVFAGAGFVIGSLIGLFVFTLYLVAAQLWKLNLNELFAGLGHEGYKNLLRLAVNDEGVEVHAIGFASVPRWKLTWENGRPHAVPSRAPEPEIIDRVRIDP